MAKGKGSGSTDGQNGGKRRGSGKGRKRAGHAGINRPILEIVEEMMVQGRVAGHSSEQIAKDVGKAVDRSFRQAQRYMSQVHAKWEAERDKDPGYVQARRSWVRDQYELGLRIALGEVHSHNVFVEGRGPGMSETTYTDGPKTDLASFRGILKDLVLLDGLAKPIKIEHSGEVTGVLVVPGQRVAA